MPSFLSLPSRLTQQPRQATVIDRGNRLSAGLAGAWIPPAGTAKSINGATIATTPAGLGFLTTTTAYWQASANAVISLSPTWTILAMVSGAQAGTGNGFPLYCERPNATQLLKLQIGLGATSTANIVVRDAGGVGLVNISGTTDVRTMTGGRTIVGTRRALTDHRLFVNGIQEGSSVVNPGSTFADTSATLGYDMQDATAALTTAALPIVLVWKRSLTDSEIAEVSRNPWQVFKAPPRRIWVPTTSVVDTSLTGSASVQSTAAGALNAAIRLAAAGAVVSSASGSLLTAVQLSGVANVVSSSSVMLLTSLPLTSLATVTASANAALAVGAAQLSATAAAAASSTAQLTTQVMLAATATASATMTASFSVAGAQLSAAPSASANASAALTTATAMAAAAVAQASASATLAGQGQALVATASARTSASAALTTSIGVTAVARAEASGQAALSTRIALVAIAVARASAAGEMSTRSQIEASMISPENIVSFSGRSRVVTFVGRSRIVRF